MKRFALLLAIAITTFGLSACDVFSPSDPKPTVTVYPYEGTFVSDSRQDLTGYEYRFGFAGTDCNDYREGKLQSDQVMSVEMQCSGEVPHSIELYTNIFNPAEPGPYATFDNVSWVYDQDEKTYKFTFHVK